MKRRGEIIAIVLIMLAGVAAAGAQTTDTATPEPVDDVSIWVNLTAKELKFDVVPNPTVVFPGRPKPATVWQTIRTNLPDKVEPGVTYRDIGIVLKISSRFADIDRIVAEALGEVPVTSDESVPVDTPAAPVSQSPAPARANRHVAQSRKAGNRRR